MIAMGFARYGLMNETVQTMTAIFETSLFMQGKRLPELFCGFRRIKGKPPTLYPVACSPQAWAVGALFMLLQACLGMKILAADNVIEFCLPTLPSFVNDLTITNLRINNKQIVLQIRRSSDGIDAQVLSPGSGIEIRFQHKTTLEYA
jgi:glycogen debranching enzyme